MQKLKVMLKNGEKTEQLEKPIDFIPSKGLIIYKPIYGTIGTVVYDKNGYTAQLESVLEPTDPENQLEYLKSIGFTPSA